jgi:hypothetical protein
MKPEYNTMTGQQLLAAYNAMAGQPRKSKFHTREDGVVACEKLWAEKKPVEEVKAKEVKAKKNGNGKAKGDNKSPDKSSRLDLKITLLVDDNPRRVSPNGPSDAHRHFEAMRGGITIREYLAKFKPEDRRKAGQWLSNTKRDKFVRVG